jgi:hypothetical protein
MEVGMKNMKHCSRMFLKDKKLERNQRMAKKQICLVITFLVLFLSRSSIVVAQEETALEMTLWNRYTYETEGDSTVANAFSLERGYFRINHTFTDKISGQFNLDFFSSDKDANGAGVKLKYAYLDFKELIPLSGSKVTFGLLKSYFGTIYDWDYVAVEKAPPDLYKFISSTDYGLAFHGDFPKEKGEYALSVVNGEGYKKAGQNVNTDPGFIANLRVNPISGITIGGSYFMDKKGAEKTDFNAYSVVGRVAFEPVDVWIEYLSKDDNGKVGSGFMVMPIVKVMDNLELVARYDMWDPDTDAPDDEETLIIGGLNYYINPSVALQLNYENISPEEGDSTDKIILQFNWKFKTTL